MLSLSSRDAAGRAAWGAQRWPQHPQPCSEGCQTPLSSPGAMLQGRRRCWGRRAVLAGFLWCGVASEPCQGWSCPPLFPSDGCRVLVRGQSPQWGIGAGSLPLGMPLILLCSC